MAPGDNQAGGQEGAWAVGRAGDGVAERLECALVPMAKSLGCKKEQAEKTGMSEPRQKPSGQPF